ncbi:hypothetical protein ACFQLX_03275 [Streptomyces polyrhachis]|uniref:Uncharacterized protein n=1 Tax=Streptomyces polyrhachis TaxID=1282885 RepID=A0ABW2GEL0_9ACTN
MSTPQLPSDQPSELLPRPSRTPDALRLALARIAPHRLSEMDRQKNEAFSLAAQHNTLAPIHQWLTVWAGEVEIERRPDLFQRRRSAEQACQSLDRTDPSWRVAMDEVLSVVNEARAAAA